MKHRTCQMKRVFLLSLFVIGIWASQPKSAQALSILVYDLSITGTEYSGLVAANPGSWTLTSVSGAGFAALTTAQIASFDVIWVSWTFRNNGSNDSNAGLFANAANLQAAIALGTGIIVEDTFGSYGFLPGTPGTATGFAGTDVITAAGASHPLVTTHGLTQADLDGSSGDHSGIIGAGTGYIPIALNSFGHASYVADDGSFGGRIVISGHDPDWHAGFFGNNPSDQTIIRALVSYASSGTPIPEPSTFVLSSFGILLFSCFRWAYRRRGATKRAVN